MTFRELLRKYQYLNWTLLTVVKEDDSVNQFGTCRGTQDGELTLISGSMPNSLEATTEWLHILSFEGVAVLTLTTGRHMHLQPNTTVAIPARMFMSLSSPAWYGYLVVLPQ